MHLHACIYSPTSKAKDGAAFFLLSLAVALTTGLRSVHVNAIVINPAFDLPVHRDTSNVCITHFPIVTWLVILL